MIGRYRSKFKQFDDNNNLLCYSCKKYKPLDCFDKNPDKQLKYFCRSILQNNK